MAKSAMRAELENGCNLEEQGKFELAFSFYLKAAKHGSVEAKVNLANFYDEGKGCQKNSKKAIYWYRRAVASGSSEAAYNLAVHYRQHCKQRWARYWLERAAAMGDEDARSEIEEARAKSLPIVNLSKSSGVAFYDNVFDDVYFLIKTDNFIEAIEKIVNLDAGVLKGIFRNDGNHSWYVVGDCYWKLGLIHEARNAFIKSLRAWGEDVQAMWALGNCYDKLKKPWLSEYYFRKALGFNQNNQEIRFNLANALFDQGRFDEAIVEYKNIANSKERLSKRALKNIFLAERHMELKRKA